MKDDALTNLIQKRRVLPSVSTASKDDDDDLPHRRQLLVVRKERNKAPVFKKPLPSTFKSSSCDNNDVGSSRRGTRTCTFASKSIRTLGRNENSKPLEITSQPTVSQRALKRKKNLKADKLRIIGGGSGGLRLLGSNLPTFPHLRSIERNHPGGSTVHQQSNANGVRNRKTQGRLNKIEWMRRTYTNTIQGQGQGQGQGKGYLHVPCVYKQKSPNVPEDTKGKENGNDITVRSDYPDDYSSPSTINELLQWLEAVDLEEINFDR